MVDWNNSISSSDFSQVFGLIRPFSAYGKENHRNFQIFRKNEKIELLEFLNHVEIARDFLLSYKAKNLKLQRLLKQIKNVDQYIDQIELGEVTDINLFELNRCCNLLYEVTGIINNSILVKLIDTRQYDLKAALAVLEAGNRVDGSFYISNSYSSKLAGLRNELRKIERELVKEHDINNKKIFGILGRKIKGSFTISKHEQEIIEELSKVDNIEHLSQTEYTVKYQVKDNCRIKELKQSKKEIKSLLYNCLNQQKKEIGQSLTPVLKQLSQLLRDIGYVDTLLARAKVANELKCVQPVIVDENLIEINKGRHPVLEKILLEKNTTFTPRTIDLPAGVSLITGINMGGKTVTLRLIQLLTTMVHAGMPVPAESMRIGLRDYIHFSRSDEDSILTGLSHFAQEVTSIKTVLKRKKEWGLVLFDEIAHGTSPVAGESLAIAVLEELQKSNNIVVVTTHYPGIAEKIPVQEWQTKGLCSSIWLNESLQGELVNIKTLSSSIDYSLELVTKNNKEQSEALQIAKLLGIDKQIINRAKQLVEDSRKEKPHIRE